MALLTSAFQAGRRCFLYAALLTVAVVPFLVLAVDGDAAATTTTPEGETMKFLQGFLVTMPDLVISASSADYCQWTFVTCTTGVELSLRDRTMRNPVTLPELGDDVDGSQVLVTKIDIPSKPNVLTGTLPASWGRLSRLQNLNLQSSSLTGSLPAEWGGMTSLTILYLQENALSGTLPAALGTVPQLRMLYLSDNDFEGSLPPQWSGLTKMQNFYVQGNKLTGTLPESYSAWTAAKVIMARDNAITGSLPASWSALTKMVTMTVAGNQLTGTLPEAWTTLTKMVRLEAENNKLSGTLPAAWSVLTRLSTLQLEGNQFCGCVPAKWSGVLNPTVDPALTEATCATTNVCVVASSNSGDTPASSASNPAVDPSASVSKSGESLASSASNPVFAPSASASNSAVSRASSASLNPEVPSGSTGANSGVEGHSSSSSSHHVAISCDVPHCATCDVLNSTRCTECARSYVLNAQLQCISTGDGAMTGLESSSAYFAVVVTLLLSFLCAGF